MSLTTTTTTTAEKTTIDPIKTDVKFIIDISGSMGYDDMPGGETRIKSTEETVFALVSKLAAFAPNGVDLIFFNNKPQLIKGVTPANFRAEWNKKEHAPDGGTYLVPALAMAFKEGKATIDAGDRHLCLVVVTDGQPADKDAVGSLIIDFADTLQRDDQAGILFVATGPEDNADIIKAQAFLATLDNGLSKANGFKKDAKFDIVHVERVEAIVGVTPEELLDVTFND